MRILLIGSDTNAYTIAERLKENSEVDIIFAVSNNKKISQIAECLDIAETDTEELLDFAVANEINLTIVTSVKSIYNEIADLFNSARQLIFAPTYESAVPILYKSVAKKTMYKLKIPTMKFGVFERENQATDYISKERKTLIIKNDNYLIETPPTITTSFKDAKLAVEEGFSYPDNKVIIEDYIEAEKIRIYYITDGYSAFAVGSCSVEDDFVYSPNKICDEDFEYKIRDEVIIPILDEISSKGESYCGIIGVEILVNNEVYNVIEFYPFFKNIDCQAIIPLIEDDLYEIFAAAANGSLSDEYEIIKRNKSLYIASLAKNVCYDKIDDLYNENLKVSYSYNNNEVVLSQKTHTISRGCKQLKEDIDFIRIKND